MNRVVVVLAVLGLLVLSSGCAEEPTTETTPTETTSTEMPNTETPNTETPAPGTTVTVLQLNICHGGMAGCYRGDAVLAKAAEVIGSSRPQVLSVNEACSGDVERLRPAMGSARALFVAARDLDGSPTLCRDGVQRYGNILMVASRLAGDAEESGVYDAQYRAADGHKELRSWACLTGGELSACTTHLSSDNAPTALAQCRELTRRAADYPRPTVIVGDFNLKDQGSPSMRECDPSGFSRRGDGSVQHVYASGDLRFSQATTIDMGGTTDHPGWLATLSGR